ncbi:unnamed protein product [Hermetia illucens]|uniref:Uncharacterized protein n=1 Tax=Hermetia illucens TaxID=343691 RepID=A0A7R8YLX0_HERIL|nr:unnamed protein product [Hermetia illucens]
MASLYENETWELTSLPKDRARWIHACTQRNGKKLILVLFADDGVVAATDYYELETFQKEMKSKFKVTSKEADYFLGLEIEQDTEHKTN